jgi:hypothetical protein
LIPEFVPQALSVTSQRPAHWHNSLGEFRFQHLAPHLLFGYRQVLLSPTQPAFIALPEKALLDLVHLTPNGDDPDYLAGLRLQNLESLDPQRLQTLAARSGKPKWLRASAFILELIKEEESNFISI